MPRNGDGSALARGWRALRRWARKGVFTKSGKPASDPKALQNLDALYYMPLGASAKRF
jgi:hypothetical protein